MIYRAGMAAFIARRINIDGEGDAFSLGSKRTTTFMSSGMTLVESSPGRDIRDTKWRPTTAHEAPPTTGMLSLLIVVTAAAFTGLARIAENTFSRKSPI